jgi:hypothetical protein
MRVVSDTSPISNLAIFITVEALVLSQVGE